MIKIPKKISPAVHFIDGSIKAKNWIVLLAFPDAYDKYEKEYGTIEFSRVFVFKEGKWTYFDLKLSYRSILAMPPGQGTYIVGRKGEITLVRGKGDMSTQKINIGSLGYLTCIKEIGGQIYICGMRGQVYKLVKNKWVHFDKGILKKSDDLNDIDGNSSELYAVGDLGHLWHYDGKKWQRLKSPIKSHINAVKYVSKTEVYLAGSDQTFFKGSLNKWQDFSLPYDENSGFWSVEEFEGKIYVAGDLGLRVFDSKKLVPVKTGLRQKIDAYVLQAKDGQLWSFGNKHLVFFDGKKWTYIKHPDNK